eukprot:5341153-Amphidinium_carterae.1
MMQTVLAPRCCEANVPIWNLLEEARTIQWVSQQGDLDRMYAVSNAICSFVVLVCRAGGNFGGCER